MHSPPVGNLSGTCLRQVWRSVRIQRTQLSRKTDPRLIWQMEDGAKLSVLRLRERSLNGTGSRLEMRKRASRSRIELFLLLSLRLDITVDPDSLDSLGRGS